MGKFFKFLLIKVTKSFSSKAVKEILSFINENLGESHSIVVIRAWQNWMQLSLIIKTTTSVFTSKLYYMTANSNVKDLEGLDDLA